MRRSWMILIAVAIFGCGADSSPQIYSSVRSPSGQSIATKQYKGEEQVSWDVLVVTQEVSGAHPVAVLRDQPLKFTYGSDGVVMGWDGDHHLIIGWPRGQQPVAGPTEVNDVQISYQMFDPDLDIAQSFLKKDILLQNTTVDFREINSETGAKYTSTGKPVPHIQCVVKVRGMDPDTTAGVNVEIVGDGMGRSGDPYPSFGMVNVIFSLTENPGSHSGQSTLTQGKFGSIFPSFEPNRSPKQSDSSLLYQHYQMPEALRIFANIRSGKVTVKLSSDFGKTASNYHLVLPNDSTASKAIDDFNKCVATTNLYDGGFRVPTN